MESSPYSRWKLGAVIALVLLALVFFAFYLGMNKNLFTSTITLSGLFPDVSGVKPGNSVRIAGREVGSVAQIEFVDDSSVRVYVIIEKEVQPFIRSNAKMAIGSDGLLGDKVINILKGDADSSMVLDGAQLRTFRPFNAEKMLSTMKRVAANMSIVTTEFAKVSHSLNGRKGVIGRYINDPSFTEHISNTSSNINKISSNPSPEEEKEAKPEKHRFSLRGVFKKNKKQAINDSIAQ